MWTVAVFAWVQRTPSEFQMAADRARVYLAGREHHVVDLKPQLLRQLEESPSRPTSRLRLGCGGRRHLCVLVVGGIWRGSGGGADCSRGFGRGQEYFAKWCCGVVSQAGGKVSQGSFYISGRSRGRRLPVMSHAESRMEAVYLTKSLKLPCCMVFEACSRPRVKVSDRSSAPNRVCWSWHHNPVKMCRQYREGELSSISIISGDP